MSEEKQDPYFYSKKFLARSEKRKAFHDNLKGRILNFITQNQFLSKKFQIWESLSLNEKRWFKKWSVFADDHFQRRQGEAYTDIALTQLAFFEVIEIDRLDEFRKELLSRFVDSEIWLMKEGRDRISDRLSGLENKFDSTPSGPLISIDFNKLSREDSSLIQYVDCHYIKTNESYFIVRFDVLLSNKAEKKLKKIIQAKDAGFRVVNYNGYKEILRTKRFYSSESYLSTIKGNNLEAFVSDVSSQLVKDVTKYFKGFFSVTGRVLPNIQVFEVGSIKDFTSSGDKGIFYASMINKTFWSKDETMFVTLSDALATEDEVVQVVRERGEADDGRAQTLYDRLQDVSLLSGLSFACAFAAVLKQHSSRLNGLKRDIYDQIKLVNSRNLILQIFLGGVNLKYLKHKLKSIQMLLTIKRFEDEFTDEKIKLHTRWYALNQLTSKPTGDEVKEDLLNHLTKSFRFQIGKLDYSTKNLNDVFKALEEFNGYKTNLVLQLFSIAIAILGFIFTFSTAKQFLIDAWNTMSR